MLDKINNIRHVSLSTTTRAWWPQHLKQSQNTHNYVDGKPHLKSEIKSYPTLIDYTALVDSSNYLVVIEHW